MKKNFALRGVQREQLVSSFAPIDCKMRYGGEKSCGPQAIIKQIQAFVKKRAEGRQQINLKANKGDVAQLFRDCRSRALFLPESLARRFCAGSLDER